MLPSTGTGATATLTTDASGFATFQWTTATPTDSDVAVTEEDPAGVPAGFVNDPSATTCSSRTPDDPGRPAAAGHDDRRTGSRRRVANESIVDLPRWSTARPPAPAITIEKSTNGSDADDAARAVDPDRRSGRVDLPS